MFCLRVSSSGNMQNHKLAVMKLFTQDYVESDLYMYPDFQQKCYKALIVCVSTCDINGGIETERSLVILSCQMLESTRFATIKQNKCFQYQP